LIYFSSKIRGSDSYWRMKKSQLYTWVYWHIEQGHGAPTLFITLSCAEYYWPDIKRLLEDRITYTKSGCSQENTSLSTKQHIMRAVNRYSIVIQEYFITRVNDWMETFAKDVLKVTHWFVRFEFAKGRGEIHAHILAIANNSKTYIDAHNAKTEEERIQIFSQYADNVLGLTSTFPETKEDIQQTFNNTNNMQIPNNPATSRLSSVTNNNNDIIDLCITCQTHKCGNYCMRYNTKSKKQTQRYCRAGCGYEKTAGVCDTPGFPLQQHDTIRKDDKGTNRLLLKRTNDRIIQSSIKILQSWRSNCDLQLILYNSDPRNPDLGELSKVTDYVVSYACKGNATHEAEKQALFDIVTR